MTWGLAPCTSGAVSSGPVRRAAAPPAPKPRAGWPDPRTRLASLSWRASVPSARRSTGACPHSISPWATAGGPAPGGRSRRCASATTHCSPSRALRPPACTASPQPRAGASWPALASNLPAALRGSGACAPASLEQASWPAVGCPPPHPTWPHCSGPCGQPDRCLWAASCRTAHCPSAGPSRREARMGPTHGGPCLTAARRRSPLMPPPARPSKPCKSGGVGDAPAHGASQDGVPLQPQWCGATGRPCGGPARMLDAPPRAAAGLHRHDHLLALTARRERVATRGPGPQHGGGGRACWRGA
jgi:hypothetical protein